MNSLLQKQQQICTYFQDFFFVPFFFNLPEKKIQLCLTHICEQSVIKNDKCNHIYPNQNMQSSFSNTINA